jgi:hypothetical protein
MLRYKLAVLSSFVLFAAVATGCPVERPSGSGSALSASPEQVDFGYVPALQFSEEVTIDLVNNSSETVTVQEPRWKDDGADDAFELQLMPAVTPFSLGPDESETISAYFAPPAAGEFVAWIEVETDADPDGPLLIPVGGCSTDPDCVVEFVDPGDDDDDAVDDDDDVVDDDDDDDDAVGDPDISVDSTLDFGSVAANQSPVGDVLQIQNVGGADLVVDSLDISGADAGFFTMSGWGGGTIAPGGAPVNLNVSFDPYNATEGTKTATLAIESNDPDEGTVNVTLTANVTEDCMGCPPELVIAGAQPVDLTLAQIYYLQVSPGTVEVSIQNTGTGALTVEPVSEGGQYCTDNPAFQLLSGPSTVAAGNTETQTWSVGQEGLEVINFNGAYAFTMGTLAPDAIMMAVINGEVANCSFF